MLQAADYLIASQQSEMANLAQLRQTGRFISQVSQLVHLLQRERGASNIWLCSQGTLFADALALAEQQVSAALLQLDAVMPAATPHASHSRLFSRIACALYGLDSLTALRQQVREQHISHSDAMAAFSQVIHQLLALVFEVADSADEPRISRALTALFSFMQGKELAGQERATGSAGFAAGVFNAQQSDTIVALIEAQERSFGLFSQFADAQSLHHWQQMADADGDIERLRRIACTRGHSENGALRWYQALTRRIDAMKQIEDRLVTALMACCELAMAEVQTPQGAPVPPVPTPSSESWHGFWLTGSQPSAESDALPQPGGRSLLALVREQAQRLQRQSDELAAMRETVQERKVIEQAKAWLMQQHQYDEQQAWQTLRKTAMNQNKRVIDIAQALLSVSAALSAAARR